MIYMPIIQSRIYYLCYLLLDVCIEQVSSFRFMHSVVIVNNPTRKLNQPKVELEFQPIFITSRAITSQAKTRRAASLCSPLLIFFSLLSQQHVTIGHIWLELVDIVTTANNLVAIYQVCCQYLFNIVHFCCIRLPKISVRLISSSEQGVAIDRSTCITKRKKNIPLHYQGKFPCATLPLLNSITPLPIALPGTLAATHNQFFQLN